MESIEKDLKEMLEIFDCLNIPEDRQRSLITSGLYFEFNRDDHVKLNCFRVSKLLKLCKRVNSEFDANRMFEDLRNRRDSDYEPIVNLYLQMEKREREQKEKEKQLLK